MGEQKTGKKWLCMILSAVLLITTAMMSFSGIGYAAEETQEEEVPYVQGQVLVEFEEPVSEAQAEKIVGDAGGEDAQMIAATQEDAVCLVTLEKGTEVEDAIEQIEKERKVVSVQPNYMYRLAEAIDVDAETDTASDLSTGDSLESDREESAKADAIENISSENTSSVESVDSTNSNEKAVKETERAEAVQETLTKEHASAPASTLSLTNASALDDPQITKQWHLEKIQAQEGWELLDQMAHSKVRVAVLDTGVKTTHEDLQENLNKDLSVDATKTTLPRLTKDTLGHGTHVAGIIGADSGNGKGVVGVGSGLNNDVLDLFAVNVFKYVSSSSLLDGLPAGYYAFDSDIIRGLNYAAGKNAKVINMSLGMYTSDAMLKSKVKEIGAQKCTIVAAAGNDDIMAVPYSNYPSDYAECIGVIATTKNKKRASFSNYGNNKDISAPGEDILSTIHTTKNYDIKSGTSMAAPVVSGAAALLYSIRPKLTANQVKYILYNSTDDLYTAGKDKYSGYGQVNVYKALRKLKAHRFVTGVKLSRTSVKLGKGRGFTLKATVSSTATNKRVKWTSSNTRVATVSSSGKVTAKAAGTATITARPKDGSPVSKSCKVTVLSVGKPKVTKVKRKTKTRSIVYSTSVKNADGYEVLYSRDKKFRKYRHTYRTKYRPMTIKSLTSGKRYYFKVRAYKKDSFGNRIYGSYSNVKSN